MPGLFLPVKFLIFCISHLPVLRNRIHSGFTQAMIHIVVLYRNRTGFKDKKLQA